MGENPQYINFNESGEEEMGENPPYIDPNDLYFYCDGLVEILRKKRDSNILTTCLEHSKSLKSASETDFNSTQIAISDYQKKIEDCRQKIEVAKSEVVGDKELNSLQKQLDEELKREQFLREELRVIVETMNDLDNQRISMEEEHQRLKRLEKEEEKEQRKLSLYASVSKIIPDLESQSKVSGHIVERNKEVVKKFEFDPTDKDAFDICDNLWNMINQ